VEVPYSSSASVRSADQIERVQLSSNTAQSVSGYQFYYVLYAILRIVAVSINLDILDASCQFFELDRAEICLLTCMTWNRGKDSAANAQIM